MTPWWQGLGPAIRAVPPGDAVRAALGGGIGLFLAGVVLWALSGATGPLLTETTLIAPLGATAFLIFAVPSSPLAQPWPAVLGNTLSALSALAILQLDLPALPTLSLSVVLAMLAMALTRSLHPPGGAVAIATVLLPAGGQTPPLYFALTPVAAGTVALVLLGIVWHRATGRLYPFTPAPT